MGGDASAAALTRVRSVALAVWWLISVAIKRNIASRSAFPRSSVCSVTGGAVSRMPDCPIQSARSCSDRSFSSSLVPRSAMVDK